MALTANYSVPNALREDFSSIITTIDPTFAPVTANIAETDVKNPEGYEHQVDALNAQVLTGLEDGFSFADATDGVTVRTRLLTRCMIQSKSIEISNRLEETDKAGVDSEISYQLALRSEDLQRDCEGAITNFATPAASASGTAPLTAGIPTWIRTNASYGATGAAPTLVGKEPVVGTAGTQRALDESEILTLLGSAYTSGGNIDMFSAPVTVKQLLSQYFFTSSARIAVPYQDHGADPGFGLSVVGAVDFYRSDFGNIAIVPNRFQAQDTDLLMLDTSLWEKGVFRGYQVQEMGIEGDKQRFLIVHDFCLISRDEAGSAIYADIDDTTPMVA